MTLARNSIALAVWLLCALAARGFDAYLKIDTVDGESTDSHHVKWIDIESFAHEVRQTGRPTFSDLCLVKTVDRSSPVLAQACAKGARFTYAILELITTDANRTRFYRLELTNVAVTVAGAVGNSGANRPAETLCLSYSGLGWTYTEVDASGVPVGDLGSWWDLVRNTGGTNTTGSFTVSATQLDTMTLRLSWTGKSGRTYNVLGSPTVAGNYQLIQTLTAPGDGVINLPVAITGGAQFFRVQEAP